MVDDSGTKVSQLCVVALIGKSSLFEQQCNKSWKLNQLIQMPAFKEHSINNTEQDMEYYYDHINNTIYVHLRSFHDTYQLLNLIDNIHDDTSIHNFAQLWENKQASFIKKCLICFLLSHVIVVSHSSHTFDLNYLRFFRIIEALRHKSKPVVLETLRSLNLLKETDTLLGDGRLCVPRALFVFENHHHKGNDVPGSNDRDDDQKLLSMAHNLEDIIFNALRSSYVISNQTNSALFTVAHQQPFVFIHRCYKESSSLGQTQKLLGILQGFVKQTKESSSNANLFNRSSFHQQDDAQAFKRFLFRHLEDALTNGWSNDGISGGARSESSSFELCTYTVWTRLFNSLRELFEATGPASNKTLRQAYSMLRANVDPDGKLSETRCKKCLPMAVSYYEDGLPPRYTRHFHEQRLQAATEYFATYARGSSYKRYVQQLIDQCTRLWQDGRQLCEATSLTGNPCKNELHRVLGEEDAPDSASLAHLPVRAHNSKVQLMAASNCGQMLQEREDPFTIKEANYDFYQDVNKKLPMKPIYFEFPIFRGAAVSNEPARAGNKQKSELRLSGAVTDLSGTSELSQSKSVALYSPVPDKEQQELDSITDEKTDTAQTVTCTDDVQPLPSTTEYLDGMTHSDSPPGLLPRFSSWSLCCVGRASDYVPAKGLQQPNFLTNLNHLLSWDINPHSNQASSNNPAAAGAAQYHQQRPVAARSYKSTRRGATSSSIWDVTVRVYIGCEYECPRGHRFLCSSPNHVIRVGQNGIVKDDGAKLVRSDMPLYTPCSCRMQLTGARVWAQLMRAYVVTPASSTPLQCVLHPQVIPAGPNNPTFFPSYTEPIHLTEDSIWVLRFPFIYHDGERALYRPQNEEDISQCLVLRDLFSWTNKS